MGNEDQNKSDSNANEEFRELAEGKKASLVKEFWIYLKQNKKWWLIPIIVSLLLISVLIFLAGTGAAPFIYTIF